MQGLEKRSIKCKIDTRDLPYGEKFRDELREFIRTTDTVLFLVSPKSIASEWCRWEVAEVAAQSKRLVPVVLATVPVESLPPQVGEVNLFPFTNHLAVEECLDVLAEVLLTDRTWLKEHTRLADLAADWLASGRSNDRLLRGAVLSAAETWLESKPASAPRASQTQFDFILASQLAAKRRALWWAGGLTVFAIVALALAGFAYLQRNAARSAQAAAETSERKAVDNLRQAQIKQSQFWADLSRQQLQTGDAASAMLIALEALPDVAAGVNRPYRPEAENTLYSAWQQLSERVVLAGHEAEVVSASFSADGRRIVTVSNDDTARVWDALTGGVLAVIRAHKQDSHELESDAVYPVLISSWVSSAAFSPDGNRVVTASFDKTARIWNSDGGAALMTLAGHDGPVKSAVFSPDGTHVVTASDDGTARIWDARTGKELRSLAVDTVGVIRAEYTADGKHILTATGPFGNVAQLWNAETGAPIARIAAADPAASGLRDGKMIAEVSPDGRLVLTVTEDESVRIWRRDGPEQIAVLTETADGLLAAQFNADASRVATVWSKGKIIWWDAGSGKRLSEVQADENGFSTAALSADLRYVVTTSENVARVFDATMGKPIATLVGHAAKLTDAVFSPTGGLVATLSADRTARLWSLNPKWTRGVTTIAEGYVNSVGFSPDGTRILTSSNDRTAQIRDRETGKSLVILKGHSGFVAWAAFSLDGRRVVTGSDDDRTARVWDAASGNPIAVLQVGSQVGRAAFSPDGSRVATGAVDLCIWNVDSAKCVMPLEGIVGGELHSVEFSRDGREIVAAARDAGVIVWDAVDGSPLAKLQGTVAAFSPNGEHLAIGMNDNAVRIVDWQTGRELATLVGHSAEIKSIQFNSDGRRLLTSAWDGTVRLWDIEDGREIAVLRPGVDRVDSAAMSSDGRFVVAIAGNILTAPNSYALFQIFPATEMLVDAAKALVPRCLTAGQRRDFVMPMEPLRWCLTGVGHETMTASTWTPKWPFEDAKYKEWLVASDRAAGPAADFPDARGD